MTMAYDYTERQTDAWDWAAQCALWRERAMWQAQRAEFFRTLAEAERNGTTLTPSGKEPRRQKYK
jgi:hypothetical protein